MKHIKILSDYSPVEQPNILHINYDEQGDIHVWTYCSKENEDQTIRLARSGSRHDGLNSVRIWKAFKELISAYEEELDSEYCHPALKNLNK